MVVRVAEFLTCKTAAFRRGEPCCQTFSASFGLVDSMHL